MKGTKQLSPVMSTTVNGAHLHPKHCKLIAWQQTSISIFPFNHQTSYCPRYSTYLICYKKQGVIQQNKHMRCKRVLMTSNAICGQLLGADQLFTNPQAPETHGSHGSLMHGILALQTNIKLLLHLCSREEKISSLWSSQVFPQISQNTWKMESQTNVRIVTGIFGCHQKAEKKNKTEE